MRTTSQPDASQPDALTAGQVDEICDRFERAYRGGKSLRIETCLQGAEGRIRVLLLRELLLLELDLRLESGERPGQEEYLQRFPSDAALIEEIFQQVTQSRAPSGVTTIRVPDSPSPSGASAAGVPPELKSFGDYEVLEQLGCGGMGVVYRARQRSANRIVALKLIRQDHLSGLPGAHRKEIIDRFHNEALATASLDHDHIVTVYEVGEIDGQHFFSMQYVGGPSLSQVLTKGPMQTRQAAKNLIPVARALHAAHQHGVLHRDVNPRNLLVDPRDNRLLVADFGLAKLREADVELTKAGTTFGSPPYMAPEQVRDAANVGEAADVYGLGATLYQMLTGRPPFQAATVADTLCQVLTQDPAAPRELNPAIDRDLDTICMKCLEKDPARRYRSAEEVADELERYVSSQPILARPVGYVGRFCRWCRRNPTLATVVITAATLLTILSLVAGVAAVREAYHREKAEQSFSLTRESLNDVTKLMWEHPAMKWRGLESLRREQLNKAAGLYDKLATQRPDDPDVLADLGEVHYGLADMSDETGELEKAEEEYRTALEIQQRACQMAPANDAYKRDRAESFAALARLYQRMGKFEEAKSNVHEALEICLQLSDEDPENRRKLADSYAELGDIEEKVGLPGEVLLLRIEELNIRDELADLYPHEAQYQRELAKCLGSKAKAHENLREVEEVELEEAGKCYERALSICGEKLALEESPENPDRLENHDALAVACSEMGVFYQERGRADEAVEAVQRAQTIMEKLAEGHRDVPRYRQNQALGCDALARVYLGNGRFEDAENARSQAVEIFCSLADDFPSVLDYRVDCATGYHLLAQHYLDFATREGATEDERRQALEDAEENEQEAVKRFGELAQVYSGIPDHGADLARVQIDLSLVYVNMDRVKPAQEEFHAAVTGLTSVVKKYPNVPDYQDLLKFGLVRYFMASDIRGARAKRQGDFEEAHRWYTAALEEGLEVEKGECHAPHVRKVVCCSAEGRAEILGRQGRHADALTDWQLAIEYAQPENRPRLQLEAEVTVARSDDHAAAATKAEEIFKAQPPEGQSGELAFSVARVFAQASRAAMLDGDLDRATAEQQRQTYASKAMDYLRMAQSAGVFDDEKARKRLRDDPDFDPLRQHDDFRKLLEGIGDQPDAKPPPPPPPPEVQPPVASELRRPSTVG